MTDPAPSLAPLQLSGLLGTPHWYHQLRRPLYAVLCAAYDHTQKTPDNVSSELSAPCLGELVLTSVLGLVTEVDLTQNWNTTVLATDASSQGFGVTRTVVDVDMSRRIGRLARQDDIFVTLEGPPPNGPEKPRVGIEQKLPLRPDSFTTLISKAVAHQAHSGTLEMEGVVLALRWLSRSQQHFGLRQPLLVDAQAVLKALKRGRTSAPTLVRGCRRAAALTLAMGLSTFFTYIPSEWNPADAPSRRHETDLRRGSARL